MSYMHPMILELVPKEMKQVTNLNEFKTQFKIRQLENCLYRHSVTYLPQIGVIA